MGLIENQDFELVDAGQGSKGFLELLELGGRRQVPFLQDGEVLMYESKDILKYVRNKKLKTQ